MTSRRPAFEQLGEQLLVETRDLVDLGVVVEADASSVAVDLDEAELLVLVQGMLGVRQRDGQALGGLLGRLCECDDRLLRVG